MYSSVHFLDYMDWKKLFMKHLWKKNYHFRKLIPRRNSELLNSTTPLWFPSIQKQWTFFFDKTTLNHILGQNNFMVASILLSLSQTKHSTIHHCNLVAPYTPPLTLSTTSNNFWKFKHFHLWFQIIITKKRGQQKTPITNTASFPA